MKASRLDVLCAPSRNYVGPVRVFGLEADADAGLEEHEGLPVIRPVDDFSVWMPDNHKKEHIPGDLPPSLRESILAFALVCAARIVRGQGREHNTMLVHVTRFTAVQARVADQVSFVLQDLRRRLRHGEGNAPTKLVDEMRGLWVRDFVPTSAAIDDSDCRRDAWNQVQKRLLDAVSRIEVRKINGTVNDILDYSDQREQGISVIAIGGDKLSRGLTLEGLSVSYYLRATKMYDTLMQMGRWFGYRPGYLDLCRLYTSPELIDWYEYITLANEELRSLFDQMAAAGGSPRDFGIRVRSHPDLLITGPVKMRNGHKLSRSRSPVLCILDQGCSIVRHETQGTEVMPELSAFAGEVGRPRGEVGRPRGEVEGTRGHCRSSPSATCGGEEGFLDLVQATVF